MAAAHFDEGPRALEELPEGRWVGSTVAQPGGVRVPGGQGTGGER